MKPYHRTLVFWLSIITIAYTSAAGAVATMAPTFAQALPEWLKAAIAIAGVAIPVVTAFAKRLEAPRTSATGDTDEAGA